MRTEWKKELRNIFDIKRLFLVLLGNTIYSVGVVAFIVINEVKEVMGRGFTLHKMYSKRSKEGPES